MQETPPEGFEPHFRKSGLTDPWEPLYSVRDEARVRIGLFLREPHCNSRARDIGPHNHLHDE